MESGKESAVRYGMTIDLDLCTGCGSCMVACAAENNVAVIPPEGNDRTGITWIRVYRADNGLQFPDNRSVFIPVPCQHCDHHTPCLSVCPVTAVDKDPRTGIISQIPERCMGCRYCMAACPYHARYFNWWDSVWPEGMEKTLNPDVSPRMRGVVEKCNFCHGRLHRAREKAALDGREALEKIEYTPACVEACPTHAIKFGNLHDPESEVAILAGSSRTFRLLEKLGTEPKVYYLSDHKWVRDLGESALESRRKEKARG